MKSFEEQFDEAIKRAMEDSAGLQEAFICEQLRDNFDFDEVTQTATIKSYVKVRLAEIEDYKQKVRNVIGKKKEIIQMCIEPFKDLPRHPDKISPAFHYEQQLELLIKIEKELGL